MARKKSYQKGTVLEAKNKGGTVYRLRYRKRDPEGGWTEITETLRGCPSKKAARKELDNRLQKINASNGGLARRELRKFSEILISCWPNYLDTQNVKGSTRYTWDSITKKWIAPFFGDRMLEEIEPYDIGDFMGKLFSGGLSAKYRRNIYNILKLMLDVARENGLMRSSPIRPRIHRPKVTRTEKPSFTLEQAKAILWAVEPIYRAPLATLGMTGIREGELLGFQWQDFDFLNSRITIARSVWRGQVQTPKTEESKRTIGMPEPLAQILLEHRRSSNFTAPDDFVFCQADGRPMDPDSLRNCGIYPALKKLGIPLKKRASGCHAFRHLVGSVIHKETGSLKLAQEQLGHSNISTTGDIYTHVDETEKDRTASILGKAFAEICGKSVVEGSKNVQ